MVDGQPFFIQRSSCNLVMETENIKVVMVWVKIFSIPLEFWSVKGLNYLVSSLGEPLYLDLTTMEG